MSVAETELHPVYRCEWCGYWEHRNGQVAPVCPYCRDRGKHKRGYFVPLWPAFRKPPVVNGKELEE